MGQAEGVRVAFEITLRETEEATPVELDGFAVFGSEGRLRIEFEVPSGESVFAIFDGEELIGRLAGQWGGTETHGLPSDAAGATQVRELFGRWGPHVAIQEAQQWVVLIDAELGEGLDVGPLRWGEPTPEGLWVIEHTLSTVGREPHEIQGRIVIDPEARRVVRWEWLRTQGTVTSRLTVEVEDWEPVEVAEDAFRVTD